MSAKLTPYLAFGGKTKEAMEFYKSVLGGDLKMQTYGEAQQIKDESQKDLIMHASLENGELSFMASDGNSEHPVHMGDNISLSIAGDDETKLTEYFNKLAEGGKVTMPLEKQFWGDTFGMLIDKFGIQWMINVSGKKGEEK
ncbi:MAG TPA: VOC family protein [Candidatus Saccharimonadales bacterium]|nr:VOC family protein [Candidatus Saccharimonadales bacterium]